MPEATPTAYDLVVVAGQSNASGRGVPVDPELDAPHPRVWQYANSGDAHGRIVVATEPLAMHDVPIGIGPGLVFARRLADTLPAERSVLIVPTAHGGTMLSSDAELAWRPGVPGNLYAASVEHTRAAAEAAGAGSRVVAVLWVQGETDGDQGIEADEYRRDLEALIAAYRRDLGIPDLPFIIGQLVPDFLGAGTRAQIDAVHQAVPSTVPDVLFVPSPPGEHKGDGSHFNAVAQRIIGARMFDAYERHLAGGS